MTSLNSIVLVGNALSVMVAATQLARRGRPVIVVNGTGNWGGHFSRMSVGGTWFDPGMVTYEFTSFSPQASPAEVSSYDPRIRSDVGRFCDVVKAFVSGYQQTRTIDTPRMFVHGKMLDDLIIANSLESLRSLPFAKDMERELASLPDPGPLHASLKRLRGAFDDIDLQSASRANHGSTFHEQLIEPLCRKLLGIPSRDILARYHRVAWLPLFYPETLLSYLRSGEQRISPTTFSYPLRSQVGALAEQLRDEILASPSITVVEERPSRIDQDGDGLKLHLANGDTLESKRMAWSFPLGDLLRAVNHGDSAQTYEKCSVALVFVRIARSSLMRQESVALIVDQRFAVFRITNQTACSGDQGETASLVVEANPDVVTGDGDANRHNVLAERVKAELADLGWVHHASDIVVVGLKVLSNALMLPTIRNRNAHSMEEDAAIAVAPMIQRMGPASGFFTSSLNDQIVQGLKFDREAEEWP